MTKASDRAYAVIRTMILSGEITPGAQISEEALARRCAVSRTPVRDALRRLEADLLIRRNTSQRVFVSEWSRDDIEDAFDLRAMLEAQAARRAAERVDEEGLARLAAHNAAMGTAVNAPEPDIAQFLEHNRAFHEAVLDAARSPRLASLLSRLVEQPIIWRTAQNYNREHLLRSFREHEELLEAFHRKDGPWAASIMAGHIRRAFHVYLDACLKQVEAAA
jgi:DNA-binding GntR family transcriptional regulator